MLYMRACVCIYMYTHIYIYAHADAQFHERNPLDPADNFTAYGCQNHRALTTVLRGTRGWGRGGESTLALCI